MNGFRTFFLLALPVCVTGCGSSHKLGQETVRKTILNLGLMEIRGKDLEIRKVSQSGNRQAVAVANLNLVFQLSRNSQGKWDVEAVRFSDRNWVRVKTLLRALDMARDQQTRQDLNQLAKGVRKFRTVNGADPQVGDLVSLTDLLFPRHMPALIRFDAWGNPLVLKRNDAGTLEILSLGADGTRGTDDDIVVSP